MVVGTKVASVTGADEIMHMNDFGDCSQQVRLVIIPSESRTLTV